MSHVDFLSHGITTKAQYYVPSQWCAICNSQEKTWETVEDHHPNAW
jgi:hypothetical protein